MTNHEPKGVLALSPAVGCCAKYPIRSQQPTLGNAKKITYTFERQRGEAGEHLGRRSTQNHSQLS
ncbi:MAG TPA: hypothetical protein VMZ27_13200 [Candidatus Saccharimonadales bacterium]|nr:hypothetical protein [Candidatus Saccharimonadales bacterium]